MTDKEIRQFTVNIDNLLSQRRLGEAFDLLRNTAGAISSWKITDRVSQAEQGYGYMLRYMIEGVNDPERDNLYDSLLTEAATIRDLLVREMYLVDTPTLYYNTLRSINMRPGDTLDSLIGEFRRLNRAASPFESASAGNSASGIDTIRLEMIERDLFNLIWVSFPLTADDYKSIGDFIADDSVAESTRALIVSAVTLGLLEFYDERRVHILFDAYRSSSVGVSVRALIGLVISFSKYRRNVIRKEIRDIAATIRELPGWQTDIEMAFVELIRTSDTDRISEKIKDEIIPEIQKMGRDLADKFKDVSADPDAADINPEWDNIMSDSKIMDNLKEFGELQQEGADVFMATFSNLKHFPFFNDVANWFLPYRDDHSVISSSRIAKQSPLAAIASSIPHLCDSDKYSVILSLSSMPEAQQRMMLSQLDAQNHELAEMLSMTDRSLRPVERKSEINNYVLSIYRFFKLFRRKGEFFNPFATVINPIDIPAFEPDFDNETSLATLGEFYFKVGLYDYAADILIRLDRLTMPEAARYQKIAYSFEKLGKYERAATFYEQSDLLDGNNIWNLRHFLAVLRRLGRYEQAISVGRRLEALIPDDIRVALTLGYLYVATHRYDEAIDMFHKAEFLDEKSTKPLRPLAWVLFLSRRYDEARSYYDKILLDNPSANDYLNMGHLAWASGNLPEAINLYKLASEEITLDRVIAMIREDRENLETAGADTSVMTLLIDALIYATK